MIIDKQLPVLYVRNKLPAVYRNCKYIIFNKQCCYLPAGYGTIHSGEGYCYLHGGILSDNFNKKNTDFLYESLLNNIEELKSKNSSVNTNSLLLEEKKISNFIYCLIQEIDTKTIEGKTLYSFLVNARNKSIKSLEAIFNINEKEKENSKILKERNVIKNLTIKYNKNEITIVEFCQECFTSGIDVPTFMLLEYKKYIEEKAPEENMIDFESQKNNLLKRIKELTSDEAVEESINRMDMIKNLEDDNFDIDE